MDAAELVSVEYEPLRSCSIRKRPRRTSCCSSPTLGRTSRAGRPHGTRPDAVRGCDVVVSDALVSQRMAACPLEVRSAAAERTNGKVTAWLSTQVPHRDHHGLCPTLGLDPHELRIIAPDVGGGFGAKARSAPRRRSSSGWRRTTAPGSLDGDAHREHERARPRPRQWLHMTLGGTRDGKVLAYKLDVTQDCGAYPASGPSCRAHGDARDRRLPHPPGRVEGRSVVTNTTPMTTFRGAGRPEAAQAIERMMDLYAAEIGMDPAEVRRKNFIPRTPSRTRRTPASRTTRATTRVPRSCAECRRVRGAARRAEAVVVRAAEAARHRHLHHGDHEPARRDRVRRGRDHG